MSELGQRVMVLRDVENIGEYVDVVNAIWVYREDLPELCLGRCKVWVIVVGIQWSAWFERVFQRFVIRTV